MVTERNRRIQRDKHDIKPHHLATLFEPAASHHPPSSTTSTGNYVPPPVAVPEPVNDTPFNQPSATSQEVDIYNLPQLTKPSHITSPTKQ